MTVVDVLDVLVVVSGAVDVIGAGTVDMATVGSGAVAVDTAVDDRPSHAPRTTTADSTADTTDRRRRNTRSMATVSPRQALTRWSALRNRRTLRP